MTVITGPVFRNLIILENFFCISRPSLIVNRQTRLICESIVVTMTLVFTCTLIMNIFHDSSTAFRIFQGITSFELICLAAAARFKNSIPKIMQKIEERYPLDENGFSKLNALSIKIVTISVVSFIADIIGLNIIKAENTAVVFLSVVFAAHDAELGYFSLLFESMNARLEMLKTTAPNIGSRRYGYLVISAAPLSEQSTPLALLLLGTTLFTTVMYQFFLILADTKTVICLSLYLMWREIKSMYSLWMLCTAVARSNSLCKELALHLIGRLALDKNINKAKNPGQYKIVQRWYSVLITQQPRFISGSILTVGLSTPVLLIDLSINYMLIIVQMYLAYK